MKVFLVEFPAGLKKRQQESRGKIVKIREK